MSASIQVLTRAIQPLEILTRKDAPMCLAEIAEASGLPKSSAYPVSKAGLIMFTKCLAVEYAAEGIRANAFCPGQLLTDMNVKRYAREAAAEGCTPEETMRRAIATVPLGRFRLHDRAGAERHRGANHRALAFPPLPSFRMAFPRRPLSPFFSAFLSVFRASSTSKRRAAQ
ncbi:SDR family oxidoreductase [Bilophila wadsworthia]|uniref:SDR family oxidoreductase n=1 Tax=Bilophila wadsworthia TaxID=35833 RepID=UPI002599ECC5|nr:SDR family oxidoreductase [Bilophila wadsworthia]